MDPCWLSDEVRADLAYFVAHSHDPIESAASESHQAGAGGLSSRRLVTLTGTGGVGKTRLALEFGLVALADFPGGVWFVEFASVTDPAAIVAATAATLRVQPQPGMNTTEAVVNWLVGRRVLLILDNCEHVIDAARDLVDAISRGCPTVSLLFASREPIGVEGERVHPVRSLTPSIEGVELFVARARLADASFVPTRDDGATIVSICERLDGIPLAIEVAAARIRSMAPVDVLARLTDRFRLLRGSGRGGIDRHQTLRAKVSWSYQLLTPSERTLLDRTSVFSSGFDLAVAEVV